MSENYTLYTRSNFDGLVCAALLKEIGLIDDVKFAHPKDVQDGKLKLGPTDITASLPYVEDVYMAFDNDSSETIRIGEDKNNYVFESGAPSSARIIYEYYGGKDRFSEGLHDLMEAVDVADCATLTVEEILNPDPKGWALLNYLMDPRTGLGRYTHFRISNLELMFKLTDLCMSEPISKIMEDEDVKERADLYFQEEPKFKEQIQRCTTVDDKIAILDVRNEEVIHVGNRFMVYAQNPDCNISVHVFWGKQKQNTVIAVGKSIVNKSCPVNIGALMFEYGGGGHPNAGTCQIENDKADEVLKEIIAKIKELDVEVPTEEE